MIKIGGRENEAAKGRLRHRSVEINVFPGMFPATEAVSIAFVDIQDRMLNSGRLD